MGIASIERVSVKVALFLLRDAIDSAVRNSVGTNTAGIVVQARRVCRVVAARVAGVVQLDMYISELSLIMKLLTLTFAHRFLQLAVSRLHSVSKLSKMPG